MIQVNTEITDDLAYKLLGHDATSVGGGWCSVSDEHEAYICHGCHRETPDRMSWRVKEIRFK
jgi:hypothetical protein